MKNNWQTKKLGQILQLEYGKPLPNEVRDKDAPYPVYGANGIKSKSSKYYYDKPSIIVGRKGSAGVINLTESKFWPLDVTYFVTIDKNQYDLIFIYHLLQSLELTKLAKGIKPGINRNDVYNIEVNIPSLSEQKRIVKILDEAFEHIAKVKENAEKNLQNAKDLLITFINNIFSNPGDNAELKRLDEIAIIKGGKRVPRGYNFESHKTDHPYISVIAFTNNGTIDKEKLKYINNEVYEQIKNYTITSNDLYVSIAGTIGKTGIVPKEISGANLTENACKLIFNKNINAKYVYYFTKTSDFLIQAGIQTRVAAMPKLALSRLSTITLKVPDLETQNDLTTRINHIFAETTKLEKLYKQKLVYLDELKQSILHQAFTGKL